MIQNHHLWLVAAAIEVGVLLYGYSVVNEPDRSHYTLSTCRTVDSAQLSDAGTQERMQRPAFNSKHGIATSDAPIE
jgi:hypothetical protein